MDSEHIDRQIDEIERQLHIEDPALVRRVEQRCRRDTAQVVVVCALLASSAVLLAVGLADFSPVVFCAGVTAFLAAFVADRQLAAPDDPIHTRHRSRLPGQGR